MIIALIVSLYLAYVSYLDGNLTMKLKNVIYVIALIDSICMHYFALF